MCMHYMYSYTTYVLKFVLQNEISTKVIVAKRVWALLVYDHLLKDFSVYPPSELSSWLPKSQDSRGPNAHRRRLPLDHKK